MRLRFLPLGIALLAAAPLQAQGLVACEGGTALGFACEEVDLYARVPHTTFGTSYGNDIWGWTDPASGREFALVGNDDGTAFVEITDPDAPLYLGKLPTATGSSTWRDIKTYDHYAFVVSEAFNHGMQVFDLTRLLNVASPPQTFTADARFTGFGSAHNVVLDPESGFAFGVGTNQCAGGLYIVDVRDPLSPTQAGCFASDGYTHDAQCVTYRGPDPDYTGREVCVASNEDSITMVDVTDKANPTLIARGYYPDPGYTHQGWFTDDQRYFIVDDELDRDASPTTRTIVFDLTDLDSPEFDFFYFGPLESRDHNLYVRGDYAFLSNYAGGLRIVDISGIDDGEFVEVGSFDTYPGDNSYNFEGQWSNYPFFESGTVIANDQAFGLFILKPGVLTGTGTATEAPEVPADAGFALGAPSPNPFRDRTALPLTVARTQTVRAEVLDAAGRRVAVLYDGPAAAGTVLPLALDGADLPSGLYLVRVTGEDFTATRRVSLVR